MARTARPAMVRAVLAGVLAVGLLLLGLAVPGAASADTRPDPGTPATLAADALPTVQVNGVVWSMVTVGNVVYATGSFTDARPAGAADGTSTTPRANLVAFNLTTGALVTTFNHTLNGQGRSIVLSPDGSRVYVGGDFTTVDGVARGHIAAFDVATGALVPGFAPTVSGAVYSLAATASTVYAGGAFTVAGGSPRTRLAAFATGDGALTPWAPSANHIVRGIVLDPTGTRVVFAGQFSQVNGIPAVALASVDTAGGNLDTWDYGITNAGDSGGVYSLKSDGVNTYANTYCYLCGNIEGTVALNPTTLDLVWMNDCHGDPYDTWSDGTIVYQAGHTHDCETSGQFPDQNPRVWKRAIAMTVAVTGTLKATTQVPRYGSWTGRPHPSVLNFWPTIPTGTFTGQAQGSWSVTGGGNYVAYGGEFTTVNGTPQQSLVRFAKSTVAPNQRGPELSAADMRPNATATTAGSVTVVWPSSWDMDNETLTYNLYRGTGTTPIYTVTTHSQWWKRPPLRYVDTGRPAGSTATYRVTVSDPLGNTVNSTDSATVTVAASSSVYANTVLADGAQQYWRAGEQAGTTAYDYVGTSNLTEGAGVTRGASGAVTGDRAISTDGSATGIAATNDLVSVPRAFSLEAWVRTTSTAGGIIAQDGDVNTGAHTVPNRTLYVDADGRLSFGVTGVTFVPVVALSYLTVRSPAAVNDGQWHHVVGTVGTGGATLYIDGAAVAGDPTITSSNPYLGDSYWTFGTGVVTGWANPPSSASLAGDLDELAIYPAVLTPAQIAGHFAAAGATLGNELPTAAFDATATGLGIAVDASASDDVDGTIQTYAWNFGDGQTGAGETTTHTYAVAGDYTVTLTVTDDDGATATATKPVTVAASTVIAQDAFGRTVAGGLGVADVGGPWTASAGGTRLSVAPSLATFGLPAAGNLTGAYLGGVSQAGAELLTTFSVNAMPTGTGTYVYLVGRRVGTNQEYRVRVRLQSDGRVALALSRLSVSETFPGGETIVPGVTFAAGTPLTVRVLTTGTGSTQVAATVWRAGTTEPAAPQRTWTDTTAALQAAGSVGLAVHRPSGTTAVTDVRFSSFRVTPPGGGGGPAPNVAPTASFTATPNALAVAVDAALSADSDGQIASYAWNWGDGTPAGSGVTTTHTYTAGATYTVTLTVTDDDGATAATTRSVTVAPAANTPPTASFTATPTGLQVAVDGTGSTDPGGSISTYAWNWGDGTAVTTGPAATATHTYASAATRTVTLTVTDNGGATGSTTRSVTVTAPTGTEFARDAFNRTVPAGGLGTADVGGAWIASVGGARLSVTPGAALMSLPAAGNVTGAYLGVSQAGADVTTSFALTAMPTGTGTYVYVTGRRVASGQEYRVRVRIAANGQVFLALSRLTAGVEAFPGGELTVAGLTYTAGTLLNVRVQVSGAGTTQVTAKAWTGATEPVATQMTRTDTTPALQAAGGVGLAVHRPTGTTAVTNVRFTTFSARPVA